MWDGGGTGSILTAREADLTAREADFARRALGAEVVGKLENGSAAGGDGGVGLKSTEGEEAGGLLEAEARPQLAGCGAKDAAAESGIKGAKAVDFDGEGSFAGGGGDGTASTADGFAGEDELGEQARQLGLPAGFFFAR